MVQNVVDKAVEIIYSKKLDCVLTLIDLDGYPTASTITVSKNNIAGKNEVRLMRCWIL